MITGKAGPFFYHIAARLCRIIKSKPRGIRDRSVMGFSLIYGYTGSISNPTVIFQFKYFPTKLRGGKPRTKKDKPTKTKKGQIETSLDNAPSRSQKFGICSYQLR